MNQRILIDTESREFKLDTLVLKHKRNPDLKTRDKALLEAEILNHLPKKQLVAVKKSGYNGKVLQDLLGGKASDYFLRHLFLSREEAGFSMGPAWQCIDEGFSHEFARAIVHEAVEKSGSRTRGNPIVDESFPKHLRQQLHNLRTIKGYINYLKTNRSKNRSKENPPEKPSPKKASSKEAPSPTPKKEKAPKEEKREPKAKKKQQKPKASVPKPSLHDQVVELVTNAPHVADLEIPEGTDPDHYRASYSELIAYLHTVVYQSGKNFGNSKRRYIPKVAGSQDIPSQRRVRSACDTLDLKAPAQGESFDPKKLRSAWLLVARQYHPDHNPGDPYAERRFKEVTAAYECLAEYNESISK